MPDTLPAILTVEHLANMLGCDQETAAAKLINGELPGLKFGRGWVVPTEAFLHRLNELALEEAAKRRERPAPAQPEAPAKVTALPSMVTANSTTGQRGRTRRQMPDLSRYTQQQAA